MNGASSVPQQHGNQRAGSGTPVQPSSSRHFDDNMRERNENTREDGSSSPLRPFGGGFGSTQGQHGGSGVFGWRGRDDRQGIFDGQVPSMDTGRREFPLSPWVG